MTTMVLVTEGKHDSVDRATVVTIDDHERAEAFSDLINTDEKNKGKHWKTAQIVESGRTVELTWPDCY